MKDFTFAGILFLTLLLVTSFVNVPSPSQSVEKEKGALSADLDIKGVTAIIDSLFFKRLLKQKKNKELTNYCPWLEQKAIEMIETIAKKYARDKQTLDIRIYLKKNENDYLYKNLKDCKLVNKSHVPLHIKNKLDGINVCMLPDYWPAYRPPSFKKRVYKCYKNSSLPSMVEIWYK